MARRRDTFRLVARRPPGQRQHRKTAHEIERRVSKQTAFGIPETEREIRRHSLRVGLSRIAIQAAWQIQGEHHGPCFQPQAIDLPGGLADRLTQRSLCADAKQAVENDSRPGGFRNQKPFQRGKHRVELLARQGSERFARKNLVQIDPPTVFRKMPRGHQRVSAVMALAQEHAALSRHGKKLHHRASHLRSSLVHQRLR